MKIRRNEDNNDLWCIYSKEPIEIGEEYIELTEICLGKKITKCYKKDYMSVLIDDESIVDADEVAEVNELDFNEGVNIEGEGYEES